MFVSLIETIETISNIVKATYSGRRIEWFGGDDDDAPGWRAYLLDGWGYLSCVGSPPRLTQEEALQDLSFVHWFLDEKTGCVWPQYDPPNGWPGRQYGVDPNDCGPDSIFGMDVPKDKAEFWTAHIKRLLEFCKSN